MPLANRISRKDAMKFASLALATALAMASVPGRAEVYVDVGIGVTGPLMVAQPERYYAPPPPPAYYAPPPPPVYVAPRPVYAPRPVMVAPPPAYGSDWQWREDNERWRRGHRHHHRRWQREADDD
ncbi:hypothetical protein GCM10027082_20220 [Comamonas humi]